MTYDIKALADQAAGLMKEQGLTAPDAVNKLWTKCYTFNWIDWMRLKNAVLAELADRSHAVQRRKSNQKRAQKPPSHKRQLSLRL